MHTLIIAILISGAFVAGFFIGHKLYSKVIGKLKLDIACIGAKVQSIHSTIQTVAQDIKGK